MKNKLTPAYFIITALFMLLIPNLSARLCVILISMMDRMRENIWAVTLLIPPTVFAFLYGKFMTGAGRGKRIRRPQTLFWLYAPACIPFLLHFIIRVIAALSAGENTYSYLDDGNWILEAFIGCDLPGFMLSYIFGIPSVFAHLIADVLLITGFAVGERIASKKLETRRAFSKKRLAGTAGALAALIAGELFLQWYGDMISVDWTDEQYRTVRSYDSLVYTGGYGFRYEYGWSSVDLEPYYVENPENILAAPSSAPTFTISDPAEMPILDGAEAAYPVYSAFAQSCYENIARIQTAAREEWKENSRHESGWSDYELEKMPEIMPIRFTNTIEAFKSLVFGDTDIFFGAQPSEEQRQLAESAGKELVLTPIGKEAFVFFVNRENPVNGLTSEQVRKIYSGEYGNWLQVGGGIAPILAFQRPENSGSQTMMKYFMGDVPLKKPVTIEYEAGMEGTLSGVAAYQNKLSAIGYSFRYYAQQMGGNDDTGIKLLELDGVYPDRENIRSGAYPMTTGLYAITLADNPKKNIKPMLEWITGEQGQEIVRKTGYVELSAP